MESENNDLGRDVSGMFMVGRCMICIKIPLEVLLYDALVRSVVM